jgi:hypothetical protein
MCFLADDELIEGCELFLCDILNKKVPVVLFVCLIMGIKREFIVIFENESGHRMKFGGTCC